MSKKKKKVVIGAMVDPAGDVMEEYKYIKRRLKNVIGDNIKFIKDLRPWDLSSESIDAYVFDFGGIGLIGAPGLAASYMRELIKQIENKPGTLFIIWSEFTFKEYKEQIENEAPELIDNSNVIQNDHDGCWENKVKEWLGG